MSLQCGIVGLPNVGKSTLFNAITKSKIEAQNYPFCTIEPNVGIITVPDPRLEQLAAIVKPERVLPTTIEFVDIAGLVKGASKGEGLGNQFLANIRETDAIAHVVRCFEDPEVIHVDAKIDPISDIETVETELLLADLDTVNKALQRKNKQIKTNDKVIKAEYDLLQSLLKHLNDSKPAHSFQVPVEHMLMILHLHLLTIKPVMYLCNLDENDIANPDNNKYYTQVKKYAENLSSATPVIAFCGKIEAEISELEPEEQIEFMSDLGIVESGLTQLVHAGYKLLKLQTYFTAGVKEVRAWTIPIGANARDAAGVIHTDFAKGFIRAEVISFDDFVAYNGENGAKQAGKWRLEGKEYIVQDGDVMHFRFNV